ncbi:MAG: hypothetical protein R3D29_10650 [Nitratireductor sp.]
MSEIHVPDLAEITRAFDFTRTATVETPLLEAESLCPIVWRIPRPRKA